MVDKKPIHVIMKDGGAAGIVTTRCGVSGRRRNGMEYVTKYGVILAVSPLDHFQGPTCEKCRMNLGKMKKDEE